VAVQQAVFEAVDADEIHAQVPAEVAGEGEKEILAGGGVAALDEEFEGVLGAFAVGDVHQYVDRAARATLFVQQGVP